MSKSRPFLLLALIVLAGLGIGTWALARTIKQPPPTVAGSIPTSLAIPMPPTPLPPEGVLAALPPVETMKLIHPPPVQKAIILYARLVGDAGYYLLDPDTEKEIRLEPFPPDQGAGSPGATMRVSPTGRRILYTLFNNMEPPKHLGIGSVWTMNPDGTDKRMLAGSDELSYPVNAIWSPDGEQIAYLRFPDPLAASEGKVDPTNVELWVMNADGSEQRKVAHLPPIEHIYGTNGSMQWLLDDHIYIVTHLTSSGDWLRINPHTGEITRLMEGVQPQDIVISPDTRWIVAGDKISEEKIVALGRQPLHLRAEMAWDWTGEHVAYIQAPYPYGDQSGREVGIWVRDLHTGQETMVAPLDPDMALHSRLYWSPDGRMLLYEVYEGGNEGLYVCWIDSGACRLVVPSPPEDQYGIKHGVGFIAWVPVMNEHLRSEEQGGKP